MQLSGAQSAAEGLLAFTQEPWAYSDLVTQGDPRLPKLRFLSEHAHLWLLSGLGTSQTDESFELFAQCFAIFLAEVVTNPTLLQYSGIFSPPTQGGEFDGLVTVQTYVLPLALSKEFFLHAVGLSDGPRARAVDEFLNDPGRRSRTI